MTELTQKSKFVFANFLVFLCFFKLLLLLLLPRRNHVSIAKMYDEWYQLRYSRLIDARVVVHVHQ